MIGNAAITFLPKNPTLTQVMVTKLRAACVARQKHAEIFFRSEIFGIAKSILTDSRSLYYGSKFNILRRFEKKTQQKIHGNNSALVADLLVIVKIIGQQTFTTFMSLGVEFKAERINIVPDRYFENTLKSGTRKDRRTGSWFVFNDETKSSNNFIDNFSKCSKKKDDLNKYLPHKFLISHESDVILLVTFNYSIL